MTATNETPKVERRVRITLEGRVTGEDDAALYLETGCNSHRIRKADATIEELTTPHDWRDGDVVQAVTRHGDTLTFNRHDRGEAGCEWLNSPAGARWSDDGIARLVGGDMADSFPTVRILRYQAGGIGS